MARVRCACGQTFSEHLINGAARTHCPFCKRPSAGNFQPAAPDVNPPAAVVTKVFRECAPAPLASSGATAQEPSPVVRWGSPRLTEDALAKLFDRLARYWTIGHCPRSLKCTVSSCREAFACGALPERHSGWRFVLYWTLGVAGGTLVVTTGLGLVAWGGRLLAERDLQAVDPWAIDLIFLALVGGPTLITFLITLVMSRSQHKHVRALCQAAEATGLSLLNFAEVPPELRSAIPAIYPGGSLRRDLPVKDECRSYVVLFGRHQELPLLVARFEFSFDPLDFVPVGNLMKLGFGLLNTRLLFDRRSQRKWKGYLVAVCADLLPNTPDFLLVPNQVIPGCFIEQCFGDRLVDLPSYGHLSNYRLAAAASLPPALILGQPLLDHLAREPKWSIQVVSGHLLVWRGAYNPENRPSLPQSGAKVTELIQFATLVHKRLRQLGGGT